MSCSLPLAGRWCPAALRWLAAGALQPCVGWQATGALQSCVGWPLVPCSLDLAGRPDALQPCVGWPLVPCSLALAGRWCTAALRWLAAGALQPCVGWPLVHCSLGLAQHWTVVSSSRRTASPTIDRP